MPFILVILLNMILFLRPSELITGLEGLPLYAFAILGCIGVSIKSILVQLRTDSLVTRPISYCVIGLLVAVILSHLSHAHIGLALDSVSSFGKVIIYYLLTVGVLDSLPKYRHFVTWILLLIVVIVGLSVLQYYGMINLPALESYREGQEDEEDEVSYITRLCGPGIFNDPNDLCLILCLGIFISLYLFGSTSTRVGRCFWLLPPCFLIFALTLTQSRGGTMAFLAGILAYLGSRFGKRKAIALSVILLPIALVLFSGRQTNITLSGGTGQDRVQIWSEGMALFRQAPLFGLGMGEYAENLVYVAHNTFVHMYTELGFFGGTLFLSIFVCGYRDLLNAGRDPRLVADANMNGLRCMLLGSLTTFLVGFWSLSRGYTIPTYLLFGLLTAFSVNSSSLFHVTPCRVTVDRLKKMILISIGALIFIHVFIRLTIRR